MNIDNDIQSNDITQLSSREQLSALMDGALPEDQTRFLLRRLQHDAELAGSWERWRIAGESMRGLPPAARLPADFSTRVMAALQAPAAPVAVRAPAWRRWGSGAALVAALALVALMVRPTPDAGREAAAMASVTTPAPAQPEAPATPRPTPLAEAPQLVAATALAATIKPKPRERALRAPARSRSEEQLVAATPVVAEIMPVLPEAEIATKPWPRSILPQYGAGHGLAVGFGDGGTRAAVDNPFASSVFDASPRLSTNGAPPAAASAGDSPQQP